MNRVLVKALAAGAAVALGITGLGGDVSAGGRTTQVEGLLEPDADGSCTDNPASVATYDVSGSLVGCWYVDTFVVNHESNAGGFVATGTETFVGCLGSACGRLFTTYTFTARYAGDVELHGRCHHPIVGGDGDFEGVTGVLAMKDLPNGCAAYRGHLVL